MQVREAREAVAAGATVAETSRRMGLPYARVYAWVVGTHHEDAGGPIAPVRVSLGQDAIRSIRRDRELGMTLREIGEKYGRAGNTIGQICAGKLYADVK